MKLLERIFRKPPMGEDEFGEFFRSLGYDLADWRVKRNFAGAWELYQAGRCIVSAKPRYMCQTQTSSPPKDWQPSSDGTANVAYMMGIAVPCQRPGHIYTEEWHGMLTQGVVGIYKCLEHGPDVDYHKSIGEPRYMVIGKSPHVHKDVMDAAYRCRCPKPDEIREYWQRRDGA